MNDFLQQINPQGKKMILTVDGGGVRGMIPACCLSRIEALSGKKCNEIFDFMAGTSTGALIAAALAKGVPAAELVRMYYADSGNIFKRTSRWRPYTRFLKSKYDKRYLRELMGKLLGDVTLKELPVNIMITAKDVEKSKTVFFTNRGIYEDEMLREVAERSMSAPYYFKPKDQYIDGGVGAFNNPCLQAAIEATKYLGYHPNDTILMSFGTGDEPNKMTRKKAARTTGLGWASYVMGEGMQDANDQQVFLTRHFCPELDFRRYQLKFSRAVMDELQIGISDDDLDGISLESVDRMEELRRIGIIFSEKINFLESLELPKGR